MGRYDEAIADLTRVIDLNPKDSWAIASRGDTYRLMGRYDEAIADLTRAIEIDPEYAWAIARRGRAGGAMGSYDEAVADLTRAFEIDPDYADVRAEREALLDASGRHAIAPFQSLLSPPWDPVAYDDLVRNAFAEMVQPGRLLFNPPARMQLGQTERVEVRLARTLELDAELLKHLRGTGEPLLEDIPTAPLMAVTLKGDAFKIRAYSDEEQGVTQDSITTWEFDIRALKRGQQHLVLCVSLRIPVPGQALEHKSIPVREATIYVQVGAPALVGQFVSRNWQWFISSVIAIATVLVVVLYH